MLQDGLSSGHASDLDEEEDNPSALTAVTKMVQSGPPHLTKAEQTSHAQLLSNLLAMESLRLPPPSPAPEIPPQQGDSVAAAIKERLRFYTV